MDFFKAVTTFLSAFAGNSPFADALHKLVMDLGGSHSAEIYDAAITTAQDALATGASMQHVLTKVAGAHNLSAAHAAVVTAAAMSRAGATPDSGSSS